MKRSTKVMLALAVVLIAVAMLGAVMWHGSATTDVGVMWKSLPVQTEGDVAVMWRSAAPAEHQVAWVLPDLFPSPNVMWRS